MAQVYGVPTGASWHKAQAVQRVAALREAFRSRLKSGDYRRLLRARAAQWNRVRLVETDSHLSADQRWDHLLSVYGLATGTRSQAHPPARSRQSLLAAHKLPYVLEGVAATFDSAGCPTSIRSGKTIAATLGRGAFDAQIDRGDCVLAVDHAFAGDPNDAAEVLARQDTHDLRLWTAGNRLHFRARLRDTRLADQIIAQAKAGGLAGVSVHYRPRASHSLRGNEITTAGELVEISILTKSSPAFPGTSCKLLHAPIGVSIADPRFKDLAASRAIAAARKQLRACGV